MRSTASATSPGRSSAKAATTILALKGNQDTLHADVSLDPQARPDSSHQAVDGGHGRRTAMGTSAGSSSTTSGGPGRHRQRTRETAAKTTTETADDLLSTPLSAERFAEAARCGCSTST